MAFNGNTSLELWLDDPKGIVLNDGYFRVLRDMGIDALSVMVDRMDKNTDLIWEIKDVEKLLSYADLTCMEIILTVWPYPDREQMSSLFSKVKEYIKELRPISGVEVDTEGNWREKHTRGFRNSAAGSTMEQAAQYLNNLLDEATTLDGVWDCGELRKELTTFSSHVENGPSAKIAPHMDRIKVQAYSIRKRGEFLVPWHHIYGPGRMQKFTLDRTETVPGIENIELGVGLPAWGQKWPARYPGEAMQEALTEALRYNPVCISYWSSKHVLGVLGKSYAVNFLSSLQDTESDSLDF